MSSGAPGWALSGVSHIAALTVFGTAALITLVCCVCVARAERRSYPMALFVAGGLCIFYEPLADVLGHCMWARQNVIVEMTLFGVDLPLFAQLVHFTYFAGGLVFLLRRLERGVSPRQWWTYYACGVVIAGAAEMGAIAVNGGTIRRTGPYVLHYPLWWAFGMAILLWRRSPWPARTGNHHQREGVAVHAAGALIVHRASRGGVAPGLRRAEQLVQHRRDDDGRARRSRCRCC